MDSFNKKEAEEILEEEITEETPADETDDVLISDDDDTAEIEEEEVEEEIKEDAAALLKASIASKKASAEKSKLKTAPTGKSSKYAGLYDDGSGKGAVIPKPFNFSKPSDTAKLVAGQINTTVDEATNMSNQEILDAVNMKGGKYMMDEEELSPKQKAYRKFFNGALKKHGASSPSELEGDKKKKFFDYVKANWKG